MDQQDVAVSYDLGREDARAFHRYRLQNDLRLRGLLLRGYLWSLAAASLLAYAQSAAGSGLHPAAFFAGFAAAAGALTLGYPLLLTLYLRLLTHRTAGNPGFRGSHRIRVSPDGIRYENRFAESRYTWPAIRKIGSTQEAIYLCLSRFQTVIVPRRAFADPLDADCFLRQVVECWERARSEPEEAVGQALEAASIPESAVVLTYELVADDVRAFVRHHMARQGGARAALAAAGVGALAAWGLQGGPWAGLAAAGVALAFGFGVAPRRLERQLCGIPGVLDRRVTVIFPEGLIGITEIVVEGIFAWSSIRTIEAAPGHLFLYYSTDRAIILPRRAFQELEGAPDAAAALREWHAASRRRAS